MLRLEIEVEKVKNGIVVSYDIYRESDDDDYSAKMTSYKLIYDEINDSLLHDVEAFLKENL